MPPNHKYSFPLLREKPSVFNEFTDEESKDGFSYIIENKLNMKPSKAGFLESRMETLKLNKSPLSLTPSNFTESLIQEEKKVRFNEKEEKICTSTPKSALSNSVQEE